MTTVMLLQAFEGRSEAEATDRLEFDLAIGVDTGYESYYPTSLVGQRNRLRASIRNFLGAIDQAKSPLVGADPDARNARVRGRGRIVTAIDTRATAINLTRVDARVSRFTRTGRPCASVNGRIPNR